MNIAIIPARGGSTRIPRKNIKTFCGKPMLAWSIEAAQKSRCIDLIVVSTDDDEIAAVARNYGAIVPFMRPAELADNYTGTTAVICHAMQWLQAADYKLKNICCIYATAPLIQPADLQKSFDQLNASNSAFVFSATSFPFPIQRAIRKTENGGCTPMFPEYIGKRSQDLQEAFHDAGQFYWGRADSWMKGISVFSEASEMYPLPRWRVQDIDTLEDWDRAERLFTAFYSS